MNRKAAFTERHKESSTVRCESGKAQERELPPPRSSFYRIEVLRAGSDRRNRISGGAATHKAISRRLVPDRG